jgi:hypothetical protein
MSDIQTIMKFEFLPNEILIECFEYLNAFDIFHSFDQLNDRFNNLIRHVPLCVNFKDTNKSIFDEFCTKMIRNPEIKNQIYSLNLPNEDEYLQFKTFLSVFHNKEFPNMQKIQSILPLPTDEKFITNYREKPGIIIKLPYKSTRK